MGTHRAEAKTNWVNIHFAINTQRVYLLWANPVAIEQCMFSIYSHLDRQKTQPYSNKFKKNDNTSTQGPEKGGMNGV